MTTQFEVQARIVERRDGVRIRDDVRLATATTLDRAITSARAFAADGYTVWIFSVERSTGPAPLYRLIERVNPCRPQRPDGLKPLPSDPSDNDGDIVDRTAAGTAEHRPGVP